MDEVNTPLEDMTDEQLEAAQLAADKEAPGTDPTVDPNATATTDDDAAATAAAATTATAATPNAEADAAAAQAAGADAETDTQGGKPEGVASKDGSRVLPFAALQAERRSARIANSRYESTKQELEEAKQQIADLKAGKVPDAEITEADVAQMEADFPEQGKKMRALFDRAQALAANVPAKSAAAAEVDVGDSPAQDAIDQVPLLVEWQSGDAEKFDRAIEHDKLLMSSPKWKDKPVLERFTQAAKLTAEEFDIPFPEPKKPSTKPTPPSTAQAVADAARANPNTLSDFKGGAVPDHGTDNFAKMPAHQPLDRFAGMTDDEIDAHLAKHG